MKKILNRLENLRRRINNTDNSARKNALKAQLKETEKKLAKVLKNTKVNKGVANFTSVMTSF